MPRDNAHIGPITDIRFVQLVDGRKILQHSRDGQIWETPQTVDVRTLSEDEKADIIEALRS